MIELPDDFRDLLIELADAKAEFVVLGGHAVAFHGHPRATKDLDVLVRADGENAQRVYRALAAFGAPLAAFEVGADEFVTYDGVLQIGLPPRRIDILNRAEHSVRRGHRRRSLVRARRPAHSGHRARCAPEEQARGRP